MAGKTRPSLLHKTLKNVETSNLSITDKECIYQVFKRFEELTKADVVEVVRCFECKYQDACFQHLDCCLPSEELVYCSSGKRRDI